MNRKTKNLLIRLNVFISLFYLSFNTAFSQSVIAQFEFDGTSTPLFTTPPAGNCDGNPGTFGLNGSGQFEIRDYEGNPSNCCACAVGGLGGDCGDNTTFVTTSGPLPLNGFCNITVRAEIRAEGTLECTQIDLNPGCGDPVIDPGRDMMKLEIITTTGFQLVGGYCGDTPLGNFLGSNTFELSNINEPFINLIITGGTQETDEAYLIERVIIEGFRAPAFDPMITGPTGSLCEGVDNLTLAAVRDPLPGSTIEWYKDDILIGTELTIIRPLVTMADAGTYTVEQIIPGCDNVVTQPFVVDIIDCGPRIPRFNNLDLEYCLDTDQYDLPTESDDIPPIPGTWNVGNTSLVADEPLIDSLIFTPDDTSTAQITRFAVTIDQVPSMGDFVDGEIIELCAVEGETVELDLTALLGLDYNNIFDVRDWDSLPLTISVPGLTVDFTNELSGNYPVEFFSIRSGACDVARSIVNIELTKLEAGTDVSINQCFDDFSLINFDAEIDSEDPTGVWTDVSGSGLDLSQPNAVDISALPSGTYEYDFTVGGGPGCSITRTVTLTLTKYEDPAINAGSFETTFCPGDPPIIVEGEAFDENRLSDMLTLPGRGVHGCDSILVVNISVETIATGQELYDGCEGDGYSVIVNGEIYDESRPIGTEILVDAASNGCDSMVNINLVYKEPPSTTVTYNGCVGDGYSEMINGITYDENRPSGVETIPMGAANGCDSIVVIDFVYAPTPPVGMETYVGCQGDGYFVEINGNRYDEIVPGGTEVIENGAANGCDSTVVIDLTFNPSGINEFNQVELTGSGFSIDINGVTYDEFTPMGRDTIFGGAANGCDSIISVDLVFLSDVFDSIVVNTCIGSGFSITPKDITYDESNPTGIDTFQLPTGQDSFLIVRLNFQSNSTSTIDLIRQGGIGFDTLINGSIYNEAMPNGVDTLFGASANGCDSIVNVQISFTNPMPVFVEIDTTICFGDAFSFQLGTQVIDINNPVGRDTFTASNGADSIVDIEVLFLRQSIFIFDTTVCFGDPFSLQVGSTTFDASNPSGIITLAGQAINQCDSFVQVLINYDTDIEITIDQTICRGDTLRVGSGIYTADSLTGMEMVSGADGCDTIFTIDLSIDTIEFNVTSFPSCGGLNNGSILIENLSPGSTYTVTFNDEMFTLTNDPLTIDNLAPREYTGTVENQNGCITIELITVDEVNISPPTITTNDLGNGMVELDFDFLGNVDNSSWSTTSGNICAMCNLITVDASQEDTYTLLLIDENGCRFEQSISFIDVVEPIDSLDFYVPNTFAPNSILANDLFYLSTVDPNIISYDLSIYSRWGEEVFLGQNLTPNNALQGWNGNIKTGAPQTGLYVYKIVLNLRSGNTEIITGDILVL